MQVSRYKDASGHVIIHESLYGLFSTAYLFVTSPAAYISTHFVRSKSSPHVTPSELDTLFPPCQVWHAAL
jgi:hypothetical protein